MHFKGKTKAWLRAYITERQAHIQRLEQELRDAKRDLGNAEVALKARKSTRELEYERIRDSAQRLGEFTQRQLANAADISVASAANYVKKMSENVPPLVALIAIRDMGPGRPVQVYQFIKPAGPTPARKRTAPPEKVASTTKAPRGQVAQVKKFKSSDPRVTAMLNQAQKQGAQVRMTGSGHYAVSFGGKKRNVAATPSDNRTFLNDRTRLRNIGLDV